MLCIIKKKEKKIEHPWREHDNKDNRGSSANLGFNERLGRGIRYMPPVNLHSIVYIIWPYNIVPESRRGTLFFSHLGSQDWLMPPHGLLLWQVSLTFIESMVAFQLCISFSPLNFESHAMSVHPRAILSCFSFYHSFRRKGRDDEYCVWDHPRSLFSLLP